MYDAVEVARLLDILGNRNRRRIIELLRQKPCFVTEISETLMLSPKAVIEHLQMLERETILACQTDERRRKYYYLANDISVEVSMKRLAHEVAAREAAAQAQVMEEEKNEQLRNSVAMLARMIRSHDQLLDSIEQLNHDIETKLNDIAHNHKDLFRNERELSVIIALSHDSLTSGELVSVTGCGGEELAPLLRRLERRGIVAREKGQYMLRGTHAE
jgi:ArsR family transcriptional regulator